MPTKTIILFLAILIFAPLAFGSVELWSQAVNTVLVCLTLLAVFLRNPTTGKHKANADTWLKVPGLLPLTGLLCFMLLQLVPLPATVLEVLSPRSLAVYTLTTAGMDGAWHPISLNPKGTLDEFVRFATYILFYIATVQLLRQYHALKKVLLVICLLAGFIALEGILQKYGSPDKIYWFRATGVGAGSTSIGPWVYHNHFAGFMEMVLPICLAMFLYYRPIFSYQLTWREKILSVCTLPRANMHLILGLCVTLVYVSIFVSLSRGGVISANLSLLFLVIALTQKQGGFVHSPRGRYLLAVLLLSITLVSWFGWDLLFHRFDQIADASGALQDGRLQVWRDAAVLIRDFPLFGSGFGSFITTYPAYRTVPGKHIFDHAHNDYLELLSDGGLLGVVLVGLFLLALFRTVSRTLTLRRDNFAILLTLGSMTGILALLIHSVTDFNMYNGANGLFFFLLCGIMVSASHTRRHADHENSTLLAHSAPWQGYLCALAALTLLVGATAYNFGKGKGRYLYKQINTLYLNRHIPPQRLLEIKNTAQEAVSFDPLEGEYRYSLANIHAFMNDPASAAHNYRQAIMLAPANGKFLGQYGLYTALNDEQRGEKILLAAKQVAPDDPLPLRAYGTLLLGSGKTQKALAILRHAIAMEPTATKTYLHIALGYGLQIEELAAMVPDQVQAQQLYGDVLLEFGHTDLALTTYKNSLRHLAQDKNAQPGFYSKAFEILRKHKRTPEALEVSRQGIALFPNNSRLRTLAGLAYQEMGILYRAREEYAAALLLNPKNEQAKGYLAKLEGRQGD